jgi:hypothetical protein
MSDNQYAAVVCQYIRELFADEQRRETDSSIT